MPTTGASGMLEVFLRPEGRRRGVGLVDERGVLLVGDWTLGGAEGGEADLMRGALVATLVIGAHGERAAG